MPEAAPDSPGKPALGRVVATERRPNTPHEFHFWTSLDCPVGIGTIVRVDAHYFRPAEVETLLGDATKARTKIGWKPVISFEELVAEMVQEDLRSARQDELSVAHGHRIYNRHE